MLLNLKDLFSAHSRCVSFDYAIDMSAYDIGGRHPFREPVRLYGSVVNRAGVVLLRAAAELRLFTQCDRCLKDIVLPQTVQFENVLVTELADEENEEMIVCPNQTLELDGLAVSNIILNLPMKYLCSEECRGLCPICGKNLNEGECGCGGDSNPAFEALKGITK